MINPFRYGGVVGRGSFCNRQDELAYMLRAMENGQRLFLYSERRLGKTSLVKIALAKLPRGEYLSAYVDLWPTDGEVSFATATARALTVGMTSSADRMLKAAQRFFGSLAPAISVGSDGTPTLTFAPREARAKTSTLQEVLSAPAEIARRRKRKVVVVFDEFQRILDYGSDMVERTLRSVIQDQPRVAYIFLGSRKHIIQKMFLDSSRPLYRSGTHYPLGPIAESHWLPFVRRRFTRSQRGISNHHVRAICEATNGHPFYTQHLCHVVWELCEPGGEVTAATIEAAVDLLLEREGYAYTALWESLGMNQQRFLVGLAHEPHGVKVYASDFVRRYRLRSPASAQRVVAKLLETDIIDRDNGSFIIGDRFFRIWIRRSGWRV